MPGGGIGNDSLYASNGFGYSLRRAGYTDIDVLPHARAGEVDKCTRFGLKRPERCSALAYDGSGVPEGHRHPLHHRVVVAVCLFVVCLLKESDLCGWLGGWEVCVFVCVYVCVCVGARV
jgi:hypothetical protein